MSKDQEKSTIPRHSGQSVRLRTVPRNYITSDYILDLDDVGEKNEYNDLSLEIKSFAWCGGARL